MTKVRVVHYINQFFGQIGGEDKADIAPQFKDGAVGVGNLIQQETNGRYEIVRTIICGDNFAAEHLDQFEADVLQWIKDAEPDLVIAGPAFAQGRHGVACARVCLSAKRELGIPVITAMHPLNPGVEMARKEVYVLEAGKSAAGMKEAVSKMISLADKLLSGGSIQLPEEEGYIPRGIRINRRVDKRGARRAVDMLIKKLNDQPFKTELPMPEFDRVTPAAAIEDLSSAVIALCTDGGVVPKGNPDRIEAHNASKWMNYPLMGATDLVGEEYETAHGGYDPVYVNEDPDRVLPLDAARILESQGGFASLHEEFFSTVGNVMAVNNAARFGREIGEMMMAKEIKGAILTST